MTIESKDLNDAPESLIGKVFEYSWQIIVQTNWLYTCTWCYDWITWKVTGIRSDGKLEFEITKADIGYRTLIDGRSWWWHYYPLWNTHAFPEQMIRDAIAWKYKMPQQMTSLYRENVVSLLWQETPSSE